MGNQQARARVLPSTDSTAQLVELAHPKAISVQNHHDGGVRDIDSHLNHRGSNEDIDLASTECLHHLIFLGGGHTTVDGLDPETRKLWERPQHRKGLLHRGPGNRGRPLGVALLDIAELWLTLLLDTGGNRGGHHEGLPSGSHLLGHPGPHPGIPGGVIRQRHHVGLNRGAPLGQHGDRGDIEVTKDRHRHRPGNRGGGENQNVGVGAFVAKRIALIHPKPVLLINHDQPQVSKLHGVSQQGMRSHHQLGRS